MSTDRYDIAADKHHIIPDQIRLLYISSAKYSGDWHSTLHSHSCAELFFVKSGLGQFQIEEQLHSVSPNDLVIVNPHVQHTELSINANPMEYIVLGVEGLELTSLSHQDYRYSIIHCQAIRDMLLFCLQNILKETENKAGNYHIICQDLMEILVILLMRQSELATILTPNRQKATHLCSMVRRYIDTHYRENITLDHLTEMTHVSKYYLVHAFTREYGVSPINYMMACRMEEAKQLLRNDDYSLSVISRILGFSSPSYFSQRFRKITGMSPNAYRRRSRSETGQNPVF